MQGSTSHNTSLVNEALAQEAVACARPLFDRAVQIQDFGESSAAHVVVMRPGSSPRDMTFEQAILYEESFGGVHIDGMTVAVSGMHAWFDEALAASVAWFLRALAKREVATRGKALAV